MKFFFLLFFQIVNASSSPDVLTSFGEQNWHNGNVKIDLTCNYDTASHGVQSGCSNLSTNDCPSTGTFTKNDEGNFCISDNAGNKTYSHVFVNWIDKGLPKFGSAANNFDNKISCFVDENKNGAKDAGESIYDENTFSNKNILCEFFVKDFPRAVSNPGISGVEKIFLGISADVNSDVNSVINQENNAPVQKIGPLIFESDQKNNFSNATILLQDFAKNKNLDAKIKNFKIKIDKKNPEEKSIECKSRGQIYTMGSTEFIEGWTNEDVVCKKIIFDPDDGEIQTKLGDCSISETNFEWCTSGKFLQTFDEISGKFLPETKNSTLVNFCDGNAECNYICKSGYKKNGENCVPENPADSLVFVDAKGICDSENLKNLESKIIKENLKNDKNSCNGGDFYFKAENCGLENFTMEDCAKFSGDGIELYAATKDLTGYNSDFGNACGVFYIKCHDENLNYQKECDQYFYNETEIDAAEIGWCNDNNTFEQDWNDAEQKFLPETKNPILVDSCDADSAECSYFLKKKTALCLQPNNLENVNWEWVSGGQGEKIINQELVDENWVPELIAIQGDDAAKCHYKIITQNCTKKLEKSEWVNRTFFEKKEPDPKYTNDSSVSCSFQCEKDYFYENGICQKIPEKKCDFGFEYNQEKNECEKLENFSISGKNCDDCPGAVDYKSSMAGSFAYCENEFEKNGINYICEENSKNLCELKSAGNLAKNIDWVLENCNMIEEKIIERNCPSKPENSFWISYQDIKLGAYFSAEEVNNAKYDPIGKSNCSFACNSGYFYNAGNCEEKCDFGFEYNQEKNECEKSEKFLVGGNSCDKCPGGVDHTGDQNGSFGYCKKEFEKNGINYICEKNTEKIFCLEPEGNISWFMNCHSVEKINENCNCGNPPKNAEWKKCDYTGEEKPNPVYNSIVIDEKIDFGDFEFKIEDCSFECKNGFYFSFSSDGCLPLNDDCGDPPENAEWVNNFYGLDIIYHDGDLDQDGKISSDELKNIIDLYDSENGYKCLNGEFIVAGEGEKGQNCKKFHDADYIGNDYIINLSELLRVIQLYSFPKNSNGTLVAKTNKESEDEFAMTWHNDSNLIREIPKKYDPTGAHYCSYKCDANSHYDENTDSCLLN